MYDDIYIIIIHLKKVENMKFEYKKHDFQSLADSNSGPADYQSDALSTELWNYTIKLIETSIKNYQSLDMCEKV